MHGLFRLELVWGTKLIYLYKIVQATMPAKHHIQLKTIINIAQSTIYLPLSCSAHVKTQPDIFRYLNLASSLTRLGNNWDSYQQLVKSLTKRSPCLATEYKFILSGQTCMLLLPGNARKLEIQGLKPSTHYCNESFYHLYSKCLKRNQCC